MVEQIGKAWPTRLPREIEIEGEPLDQARFITVEGVPLSPRDIRQRIVFPNWKDPRVIYGFWRGEIGGPAMLTEAFEAYRISILLDRVAVEFVNSRRGTEKRGKTLHLSRLYEEAAPFYFPDFESDLREHLLEFANETMTKRITRTSAMKTTLREYDIADLAGGTKRNAYYPTERVKPGVAFLLAQRRRKLDYIERKEPRTGTVTFTPIQLPDDSLNEDGIE